VVLVFQPVSGCGELMSDEVDYSEKLNNRRPSGLRCRLGTCWTAVWLSVCFVESAIRCQLLGPRL